MAVTFRAAATKTQTNGTDGTSVTCNKPTGTVNGDLMIAVTHGYTADTFTAPSGWTFLRFIDDSTGLRSRAYWKIAASEGASYVFQFQPTAGGGAIGVSISSFQNSGGLDSWDVLVTSTTDPATGVNLDIARDSMSYAVYVWRDTTADTVTWTYGLESHDIQALDSGTIVRGQSGAYYDPILFDGGGPLTANTADATNSVTHGIMWQFAIATTAPTNETWASTGFGVEFDMGGWTDVTSDILGDNKITVTQGTSSQGGQVSPGTMNVTLKNKTGAYSPPTPSGANYGKFNLGTQARWWEAYSDVGMLTTGQKGDRYRCSMTSALTLTGDLDVRVDAEPRTWRQQQVLAAHGTSFGLVDADWAFYVDTESYLHFAWIDTLSTIDIASTVQVPETVRQTLRATIDVNNGASGNTVTFYTSDSVTGTFTQLGSAVVTAGVTTLPGGTEHGITVGSLDTTTSDGTRQIPDFSPFRGRVYEMMLKSSIGGTTVANPKFSSQTTGTYNFTDAQGNIWSALGGVVCTNRRYMFHGELAAAPLAWDTSGNYVVANAQFAGGLRRVQRNDQPVRSPLYRYYTGANGVTALPTSETGVSGPFFPVAYWPLEDSTGATTAETVYPAGGLQGRPSGALVFGDYDGFVASGSIAHFVTGSELWLGVRAVGYTTGALTVEFLLSAPSGITANATIMNVWTSGTDRRIALTYPSTDHMQLTSYDATGTQIATTGSIAVATAGKLLRVTINASDQAGTANFLTQAVGAAAPTDHGNIAVSAIGRVTSVTVNSNNQLMNDVYVGHVAVFDGTLDAAGLVYSAGPGQPHLDALDAFIGENASNRAQRLTEEEGLVWYGVGGCTAINSASLTANTDDGEALGPQTLQSFIENMRTAESSDLGVIAEARDCFGTGYRTRSSYYNQPAMITLNYSNGELSDEVLPDYDDLQIKNRVTASRSGGGSYTYELKTGPRGANTVGVYPDSGSLSLESDDQLPNQAGFRVHSNTVAEYRFPSLTIASENQRVAASSTLLLGFLRVDIGDRIVITNPPAWLPPENISQLVVGMGRVRTKFQHGLVLYTVPESPYRVGVLGSTTRKPRAGAAGSTLASSATTTATSLSVATASGSARWADSATYSGSFPLDIVIDGEQITVTAVTGTSSPQTFTVTRSVNGVVKAHDADAAVSLYTPTYAAW